MHWFDGRFVRRCALAAGALLALTTFAVMPACADPGIVTQPPGAIGAPADDDPMEQVRSGVSDVMNVFEVPDMPLKVRRDKLRELGAKYFDFNSMARSVMGYHWRELSPAQRDEFVTVFTKFIEDAYLSKLQDYSVKKVADELPTVKIQFTRETFDGSDYAQVYSTVTLKEQKDPIDLNYLMHLADGEGKVYDVTVDAISVVANYRNQINRVMNDAGYDQTVADLRAKTSGLQAQLDNPSPIRHDQ
jgi:phospholipid transport system substrate-binding protein